MALTRKKLFAILPYVENPGVERRPYYPRYGWDAYWEEVVITWDRINPKKGTTLLSLMFGYIPKTGVPAVAHRTPGKFESVKARARASAIKYNRWLRQWREMWDEEDNGR